MARVAAVIFAAGESSRFGRPKQLLRLKNKSLVRRIVDAARDANCSPIIVVTGSGRNQVESEVAGTSSTVVHNASWKAGMGGSIRTGVQYLAETEPEVEAAMLLVCDQPLVEASVMRRLISLREQTQKPIVASSYATTFGVPALFDRSCFPELLALDGDSGAKTIILSNRDRVAELPFPGGAIDIDTVEDWEALGRRAT